MMSGVLKKMILAQSPSKWMVRTSFRLQFPHSIESNQNPSTIWEGFCYVERAMGLEPTNVSLEG
jgi:hypothetical protein